MLEQSVQILVQYLILGLELELYHPRELSAVFCNLEHLISLRLQNRQLAFRVPGVKKKGITKKKIPREVAPPATSGEMACCEALGYMVRGCQHALVLFNQQNIR